MPSMPDAPLIAIVVPVFKHSVLLVEALNSAAGQRSRYHCGRGERRLPVPGIGVADQSHASRLSGSDPIRSAE